MKPVTPQTEPSPSTRLRKVVFGGSLMKSLKPASRDCLFCYCALTVLWLSVTTSRAQAPVFTNPIIRADGLFQVQLETVVGESYTFEQSTNLQNWTAAESMVNVTTNLLTFVDNKRPVASFGTVFYRAYRERVGSTVLFGLSFNKHANAGHFGTGFTPTTAFPVSLSSYSAFFTVQNDTNFPPAANVFFTGPAGSGLSNTPAESFSIWTDPDGADGVDYRAPRVSSSAALPGVPGGLWTINYKGTNQTFNVPDPQTSSRLVVLSPTVTVSGDVVQSVSWVYRDANTGATLSGAPSYLTRIKVQVEGAGGVRIYNSPDITPPTTNHALSSTVNWSNVRNINMTYDDSLDNHYVLFFLKP